MPAVRMTSPSAMSSPAKRRLAPCLIPGGIITYPSSSRQSSCIRTVSASGGMAAPVNIRMVSPSPGGRSAVWPAATRPMILSRVSSPAARSENRTAYPSMAALSWGGTAISERMSADSMRPRASRKPTLDDPTTTSRRLASICRASPDFISSPPKAKQSSQSWAISGCPRRG